MKKYDKKGFIFAETIVISTIIMASLVIIYSQFVSINNNYNRSFQYNNVNNLYLVQNIRNYISKDGLEELIEKLENVEYIDITSCSNEYFTEYIYCETLFKYSDVKTILFTREDLTNLKNIISTSNYNETFKNFIKYINYTQEGNYRLIVEFNNETYATLKVKA